MLGHQIIMIVTGILCGSILFSRYLPKWIKKVDIVALSEDHNPGTANAMQHAGIPVGLLCLLGDIFKGVLPVHAALRLGLESGGLFPDYGGAGAGTCLLPVSQGQRRKGDCRIFRCVDRIDAYPHGAHICIVQHISVFLSGGARPAPYPEDAYHLYPACYEFFIYALCQMDSLADLWRDADDFLHRSPQEQPASTGIRAAGGRRSKENYHALHISCGLG